MPTYKITDPESGQTIEVDGPSPPSEAIVRQMFSKLKAEPAPSEAAPERAAWQDIMYPVPDLVVGQAKSLGRSLYGAVRLGVNAVAPGTMGPTPKMLESSNLAQGVGGFTEQVGEGALAGGPVAKVVSMLEPYVGATIPRIAAEAAVGGTMAAVQGGDPTTGAVIGGAFPAAGAVVRGARNVIGGVRQTPEMAAAVELAKREGVPLDAATASGRNIVATMQKATGESLGGAGTAERFQEKQAQALSATGRRLAARTASKQLSPEQAGESIRGALRQDMQRSRGAADEAYSRVRQVEASAQPDDVPMPLAVSVQSAKEALRPRLEALLQKKAVTGQLFGAEARAATALDALMRGPDHLPLSTLDGVLSDLKSLSRVSDASGLKTKGQGVAAAAVSELEAALESRAKDVGVWADLQAGREATKAKWQTADLVKSLRKEPVGIFNMATMADDKGIASLREVAKRAPHAMPAVGRAYVEQLLDLATSEGGFGKARTVLTQWERLGPETRKILFPNAEHAADLDKFFLLAKKIGENPNPSGTARVLSAFNVLNTVPSWVLAKVMYTPAGVRMLTRGIQAGDAQTVRAALARAAASSAGQAMGGVQ